MPGIKKNKISKIIYIFLLLSTTICCQNHKNSKLTIIHKLTKSLSEISGITMLSDNYIYSINDSGNDAILYKLDAKGKIVKKIPLPSSKNVDWEDLAYDKQDHIYIGDFGNNDSKRKNLKIYKVSGIKSDTIEVAEIRFRFEDQKKFPPKKKHLQFDVEAMIHLNNSLYLFTKDRNKKSNVRTRIYKLPNIQGDHIAKLVDVYKEKDNTTSFITGAAINRSEDKIALLSHDKILLLQNYTGDKLLSGQIQMIKLNHNSQKEGITFKNDTTLLIVDERKKHSNSYLYQYSLN